MGPWAHVPMGPWTLVQSLVYVLSRKHIIGIAVCRLSRRLLLLRPLLLLLLLLLLRCLTPQCPTGFKPKP